MRVLERPQARAGGCSVYIIPMVLALDPQPWFPSPSGSREASGFPHPARTSLSCVDEPWGEDGGDRGTCVSLLREAFQKQIPFPAPADVG